jgi:hypothetical protein
MKNRVKEHLSRPVTIDEAHEDYKKSGQGRPVCGFPFMASDEETGDLTCQHCYAISEERFSSGGERLSVEECLVAISEDNVNSLREISTPSDAYPNEVAARIIVLVMPDESIYPYNPTLVSLN